MAISGIRAEQLRIDPNPNLALPATAARSTASSPPADGAFSKAMRGLAREIDVGEAQVARASQPHDYDTNTLIALQAGIYRYTEAVDLASKIVDRATNAVRTVLQGGGH
jgi:hypothetical protein